MWRSFFLALGIMAIIVGLESMVIESANFYGAAETTAADFANPTAAPSYSIKSWTPGEAFPWVLLFVGAIVVIYAFTLPQRFNRAA
ncbi:MULTISPECIES: hypothetical protein [Crateriforma]|uniref:Uncharacterized protein n=1 Tax=Crateriforma conspicua TaxID=2527996 RepID=A0A5C6FR71_9PLAN|nr:MULTISPECIES: hypothetical protein [Crateriforma]QDV65042.1 hypothetical protein Mal65_42110 [Crateriforma conspicua]TWT70439.1 hypothetical protein Pan14r_27450 [Crateriforma conspicua]TWU65577.1 hypothetical protein V7x_11250 [Crateriforma conspicua]